MSPDPETLALGIVQGWLEDLDDALARLVVAGLSHPDPELPVSLGLLGERAQVLGLPTAAERLSALGETLAALRPGPADLPSRTRLSRQGWDGLMELLAWLGLLRADLALQEAGVRARGVEVEAEREDVPRFTGRIWIDGITLARDRLVIIGHDADGRQALLFDPLAGVVDHDPTARPVISRLFQDELLLSSLARSVVDFDRHPEASRRGVRMLQPAFRAVPTRTPTEGPSPSSDEVERLEIHAGVSGDELVIRCPPGQEVQIGRTFEFNLVKRLASEARPGSRIAVTGLSRAGGIVPIASGAEDDLCFPAVDARAWRVGGTALAKDLVEASLWERVALAASPFFALSDEDRKAVSDSRSDDGLTWRLSWWAARAGADLPPWRCTDPGPRPEDLFANVWLRLWHGKAVDPLQSRVADLSDPTLYEVCARALLVDAGESTDGVDYLRAHLAHLASPRNSQPLPSSGALLAAADTLAWLLGTPRSGLVGDALGAPEVPLRERTAWALYRWRVHRRVEDLGDCLALAATCSWNETVISPG